MPGIDGHAVARRLRHKGDAVPILLLTARDEVSDRVAGLDAGADDYLVKPFAPDELTARLRALLRRGNPPQSRPVGAPEWPWQTRCGTPGSGPPTSTTSSPTARRRHSTT
jgi:DNA-binding response OmpR family regulator